MATLREVQTAHALKLIAVLHPQPNEKAMVEITGLAPRTRPIKRYFTDAGIAVDFALDVNDQGYSVFVNSNPRDTMAGFEENVPYVTALALDLQPERTSIEGVAAGLTRAGIPPGITANSGQGAHMYVLVNPTERAAAKSVWERLVKWTGSDRIYNVNRIMRLTGSRNWKKNPPPWCHLWSLNLEHRFDIEHVIRCLDAANAPPARSMKAGIAVSEIPDQDWFTLRAALSEGVRDIIATGERNAYSEKQISRSEADWTVVCALVRAGATNNMIAWVYANTPVGMLKYHEAGARYLTRTIESARRATAEQPIAARRGPRAHDVTLPFTGSLRERDENPYER